MEIRIGIIPLPVYFILLALIVGFSVTGKVPGEISMAIAVLAFFGFTCAELGKRLPLLRNIGAAAIFATFVPSALTYYHVLPKPVLNLTVEFTKSTNFLYLFIASIIVGSILSMDRRVLIQGFVKIFIPLAAGSVAAAIVGTAVGTALGLGARHTLLYIVVPIMAGGVGEGAIPLSIGYSELMHLPQGEMFAMVLPPVMLGSLTAIILSGALDMLGKRFPHLTGNGRLQVGESGDMTPENEIRGHVDVSHIAGAGITAITLYLVGLMAHKLFGLPAPVAMLFLAVLVKLARAVSPPLQERRVRRLQVLLDRRHVPAAVRDRRRDDALGQADRRVHDRQRRHDRVDRRDADGHRFRGRPPDEDVPYRHRNRERLPQRARRHRRRRDPDRREPDAVDAVRADRDADRRRDRRHGHADPIAHFG